MDLRRKLRRSGQRRRLICFLPAEKARDYHHHAKGILYHARMEEISRTEHSVRCAVRKDGGDDPDITTGTLILRKYPGRSRNRKRLRKTADSYYGRHGCRNCHKAGVRPARRERGDQSCAAGDDYPRGGRSVCAYRLCGEPFGGDFGAGERNLPKRRSTRDSVLWAVSQSLERPGLWSP